RVRTNNHVERTNRKLRYDEKVRYKFRSERSLDRFLRLRLDLLARQASSEQMTSASSACGPTAEPSSAPNPGGDERELTMSRRQTSAACVRQGLRGWAALGRPGHRVDFPCGGVEYRCHHVRRAARQVPAAGGARGVAGAGARAENGSVRAN